jgi:hypothetical protein
VGIAARAFLLPAFPVVGAAAIRANNDVIRRLKGPVTYYAFFFGITQNKSPISKQK